MNNENISKALQAFITGMRAFVLNVLQKYYPNEPWEGLFFKALSPDKQSDYNRGIREGRSPVQLIDYPNIAQWASFYKHDLAQEFGGQERESAKFYGLLKTIRETRNAVAHYVDLSSDEAEQLFSSMKLAANKMQMPELRNEIERLRQLSLEEPAKPAAPSEPEPVEAKAEAKPGATQEELDMPGFTDEKALAPWFNNCIPHYDIREGTLDESVFAANLGDVVNEYGESDYRDASSFFPKTYLTEGIKDLAGRVVRALNGEASENRVVSLQTGFGGGKTHSLIAVYHIARLGERLQGLPSCAGLLPKGVVPKFKEAKAVVFTNNTTDVVQGRKVSESITIYTLWGEIAYQLGGEAAYETMRKNDEARQAPSASLLKPILEAAAPALILIDELADYCNKAAAQVVGSSTLFNQTTSFMQTLTEVVSRVPKTLLLVTLPASSTEVTSSKIGHEILSSLEARITRIGASVKPVDDDEVFEVVRRRLFERIKDEALVKRVAERYRRFYSRLKSELPDYASKEAYRDRIVKAYPFHPELIDILRNRWGNDARFQRTRGVLQILASIVNDLWHRKSSLHDPQMLILTTDIELQNNHSITGKVTSLMGPHWASLMSADVYGQSSTAHKIDSSDLRSNIGKFEISKGVATTVLLASVGGLRGFNMEQLKLCVLRPDAFGNNDVHGALDKLKAKANYLHYSSGSNPEYWFDAKPNLNILLAKAGAEIKPEEIDNEILKLLKRGTQGASLNALVNPTADIPEQHELTAVILHPRFTGTAAGLEQDTLEEVTKLALKRGNSDRTYRNTLFFLVCSSGRERKELNSSICAMLACDKVLDEYRGRLEPDQQKEANAKRAEAEKRIEPALMGAYNLVVKVRARKQEGDPGLYQASGTRTTLASYLVGPVLDALKENEALLEQIGQSVLSEHSLFPAPNTPVCVKDLYEAFLKFDDKPMIRDREAVAKTVNLYCSKGSFNVAFGAPGNFTEIYEHASVPGLDVESGDYWLVDKAVKMPAPEEPSPNPDPIPSPGPSPSPSPNPEPPRPKTYSKIKVSGSLPYEQWAQLFSSFVSPLRENRLKVKVEFTAFSTPANEFTAASTTLASVKESARQLGFDFEAEEE